MIARMYRRVATIWPTPRTLPLPGRRRLRLPVFALLFLAMTAGPAWTDELPSDRAPDLRPFPPAFDLQGLWGVHSPSALGHLDLAAGFLADFADRPLVLENGGEELTVLSRRLTGWAMIAMGFARHFDVGVGLPVTLTQSQGDDLPGPLADLPSGGVGDLRIGVKGMVLDPAQRPVGLAFLAEGSVPTGSAEDLQGTGAGEASLGIVLGYLAAGFSLDYQVLYRIRLAESESYGSADLADRLALGVAAGYRFAPWAGVFAELEAATVARNFFSYSEQSPVIFDVGARFAPHPKINLIVGGGAGLTDGIGNPAWRLFAGLSVLPLRRHFERDRDRDGIPDSRDDCPFQREDADGFQDADGCPDRDNDGDRIPDLRDGAPDQAEDYDGFQDEDGVPDPDNDQDGVPDLRDACPDVAEDINGRWDEDGCPDGHLPATLRVLPDRIVPATPVRFADAPSGLDQASERTLRDLAAYLNDHPDLALVRIEVHTDNSLGPRQSVELSMRRAQIVFDYLAEHGVRRLRLEVVGMGSTRPVASNRTARGRERNRRVEFIIVDPE